MTFQVLLGCGALFDVDGRGRGALKRRFHGGRDKRCGAILVSVVEVKKEPSRSVALGRFDTERAVTITNFELGRCDATQPARSREVTCTCCDSIPGMAWYDIPRLQLYI